MGLPKISSHKRGIVTFVSMQRGTALPALFPYLHLGSFEGRKGRRDYGGAQLTRQSCPCGKSWEWWEGWRSLYERETDVNIQ